MDRFSENHGYQGSSTGVQLTLGMLIAKLGEMPSDAIVANITNVHSYRGYYDNLAFEQLNGTRLASELLIHCKSLMGKVFEGFKGGDFMIGEFTPIWLAKPGCTGFKLIEINTDGTIETSDDD